jgi:hypothetical protein
MFTPFFKKIKNLRGGPKGELNIQRVFVLFQSIPNGNVSKDNEYGMLTLPG